MSQEKTAFSIECSIQMLKQSDRTGVVSQICYRPCDGRGAYSVNSIFFNAKMLNERLTTSKVFVVKDLDGDHGYYLRMDTILLEETELSAELGTRSSSSVRSQISQLLNYVTQDTDILLKYFNHHFL